MFEERTAPSEHRARPSSRSGGEIPSIESVAAVCFFCGTSVSSPSPLKAISLRRSALFLALAPLPPSFRRDMIYCLASVPLTRTDGRATQSVEQMSKTDKKYLPMALKRHTSLAPPHRPLPPFKKCAKFNLIRSPDSDRPLPSLPIQLLFLSPFRGPPPLALPHSIVETILPSHRLTAAPIGAALRRRPPRLMSEPPLLP